MPEFITLIKLQKLRKFLPTSVCVYLPAFRVEMAQEEGPVTLAFNFLSFNDTDGLCRWRL